MPVLAIGEQKLGLAICYELSVPAHITRASAAGATLYLASVAKTDQGMTHAETRMASIAREYAIPTAIVNCLGPSDDFTGVGRSAHWDVQGNLVSQLDDTQASILFFTV